MQGEFETKVTFAERLRCLMQEKGIKNVELAKAIGVSHVAVGKYLKSQIPGGSTLQEIAKFFGVSMESLMRDRIKESDTRLKAASALAQKQGGTYDEQQANFETNLRLLEAPEDYGIDWRKRALDAEQRLREIELIISKWQGKSV